jgi:uncharacterized protein YaeQ
VFSKGLCVDDEAELWDKNLSGEIDLWVEFGQADEKWLRKACGRSKRVILYTYGGRSVPIWWQQNQQAFARYDNLSVINFPEDAVKQMDIFVNRNMALQVSLSEGQVWFSDANNSVLIEPEVLK